MKNFSAFAILVVAILTMNAIKCNDQKTTKTYTPSNDDVLLTKQILDQDNARVKMIQQKVKEWREKHQ